MRTASAFIATLLAGACLGIASQGAPPPQKQESPERSKDSQAIRDLAQAFTQAYNKGDARAVAELFTDDAEVTDETGVTIRGREAIAGQFTAVFADDPGSTIELTSEAIRFLSPDVA